MGCRTLGVRRASIRSNEADTYVLFRRPIRARCTRTRILCTDVAAQVAGRCPAQAPTTPRCTVARSNEHHVGSDAAVAAECQRSNSLCVLSAPLQPYGRFALGDVRLGPVRHTADVHRRCRVSKQGSWVLGYASVVRSKAQCRHPSVGQR